ECSELSKAYEQFPITILPKAANIGANKGETTHAQAEAHPHGQRYVFPPARVVTCPHRSIALDTCSARAREHKGAFVWVEALCSFAHSARHLQAIRIVKKFVRCWWPTGSRNPFTATKMQDVLVKCFPGWFVMFLLLHSCL